ncbi:hypothetical protein GCM10010345_36000 [Streptomyces canarius]|uniref:Uncharacterized protein n=1 Tax=Streptomyces canarius TaxID=285453 RepID=A0ABQ3CN71_9ACTN|nr:hypothetical protein GCM10010345_36000 [Streptomyces canarius]
MAGQGRPDLGVGVTGEPFGDGRLGVRRPCAQGADLGVGVPGEVGEPVRGKSGRAGRRSRSGCRHVPWSPVRVPASRLPTRPYGVTP